MKHVVDILRLILIVFRYFGLIIVPTALATGGAFWFTWVAGFSVWDILIYTLGTAIGIFFFMTFISMALDLDFD